MATSFPTGLDALTNPTSGNTLASPDHAGQHADANDAIEALEAKVGVNGSAVTSSLDYMVAASKVVTDKIDPASASTNQVLKFDGSKFVPATGASVTVADSPPTSPTPQAGDQWYESDSGRQLIYYDGFWVEIGSTATTNVNASDLSGATLASNVVSSSLTSVGTLGSLSVGGTVTATDFAISTKSMPRGTVALSTRNTNYQPNSTISDFVSVTFTAVANRYYKYSLYVPGSDASAAILLTISLTDGSNVLLNSATQTLRGAGILDLLEFTTIRTESAGSVTRKIRMVMASGNASMCSATSIGYFVVEDIGGV